MSRLNSDAIDESCEEIKGHTNWAYGDTVSQKELLKEANKGNVVIFYDEPNEEADSDLYDENGNLLEDEADRIKDLQAEKDVQGDL